VVTGVSGSGKSSLAFDVLYREAENKYLSSFSFHARQFIGKMRKPDVEKIEGLPPAISVQQQSASGNQRSTVGTFTGIYDYLRLLYARVGKPGIGYENMKIGRGLFSFNSPEGACQACKGLGLEDRLDPGLLIADPYRTLRQGALVITAPNGYIIYSQVTMEVLDQVCRSEGFNVDIPWNELTEQQKHIVLYGSDKIEIPFGKHPLESRMRWSGITAKPREMGYYKGILPIMETILKRDRNKNILRFVRSGKCTVCNGQRLNEKALSVFLGSYHIAGLTSLPLAGLRKTLLNFNLRPGDLPVADPVIAKIVERLDLMIELGLGYLTLDRETPSLSGGESQRLKLAVQSVTGLSGMLYIFDEPSIGLHPHDTLKLIRVLKSLRDQGNTVMVVEHEEEFIRQADWIIDIGPGPGIYGGEVLLNISTDEIDGLPENILRRSKTLSFLKKIETIPIPAVRRPGNGILKVEGASVNNLKNIDAAFLLGALNVVTGVSGAGKSSLVHNTLAGFIRNKLSGKPVETSQFSDIRGWESVKRLLEIDQSPIGKTPRSNPATYTGLFDRVRDLFASLPQAKNRGYDRGRFSFNTRGGRCESCQGAGYRQIGMHFMGNVEVLCETCNGKRFNNETLSIAYKGKNIFEVLEMPVSEALLFFENQDRIRPYLETLVRLGLGYLTLGQRSSTLSGGEAQRVKLATELAKPSSAHTLYILDEPTTGLHQADVGVLINALNRLVEQGHTLILIEHHLAMMAAADWIIDLGPGSGANGGNLIFNGRPEQLLNCENSVTADAYREYLKSYRPSSATHPARTTNFKEKSPSLIPSALSCIHFKGVTTHNLKNLEVKIPHHKITVLTGVSGSGKSSLAFDTLHAEGQNRFLESFSTYARTRIGLEEKPGFEEVSGLTPTFAVDQRMVQQNPRSTVGTMTGIYDLYRLLYSRLGHPGPTGPLSSLFSFNHQEGACPECDGIGFSTACDPDKLITNPEKSILSGAMDRSGTGKFYGDPFGQYVASLKSVGSKYGIDFSKPWTALSDREKKIALSGTGTEIYEVNWEFRRGEREGEHHFKGPWPGFLSLIGQEYKRKHADHRGESMIHLMKNESCPVCRGTRLRPEALVYLVGGINIASLSALSVNAAVTFFKNSATLFKEPAGIEIAAHLIIEIVRRLELLSGLGLTYICLDRITSTLSGGESQRIRLAAQLGSGLTGLTYILDEPTMGLHSRDILKLMAQVRALQESGNTVVIVEHNREVILAADHVIDMGPGAGKLGGTILAEGSPAEIIHNPDSVTGPFLSASMPFPENKRQLNPGLSVSNAFAHNLKGFDMKIPSGGIIAITGVSGSGKSSLLFDVILASHENGKPVGCSSIEGFDQFKKVCGIHPRSGFSAAHSTPATFTGIFDGIRTLFAGTEAAKKQNLTRNHFSFLNKEGRCPACLGMGETGISMDFLADVNVECELCHGKRYREEILSCRYRDHSIHDILMMTITEAREFFCSQKTMSAQLGILEKVGLRYLQLGQPMNTLSGGESQRISLASELMKPGKGPGLYLFEEPSTGLHFIDIQYLLRLFHQLADEGNTLLVIEHDPDVVAHADQVIELGPEGGDQGGYIVRIS